MAELGDGMGGAYFHSDNGLRAGLSSLVSGPEYLYILTFSTANMKPNGAYPDLKVIVKQSGLHLQARRGYFAPRAHKTKK
jgi:hypothetical protein